MVAHLAFYGTMLGLIILFLLAALFTVLYIFISIL